MTEHKCQWCEIQLQYGSISVYTILTSSNHQAFVFCTKNCAKDWLVELCK